MGLLLNSIVAVLGSALLMAGVVKMGLFNNTVVPVGFQHYAEPVKENSILKMPLNAIVNIGYVLVGLYWLWNVRKLKFSEVDKFYLDVFSIIGIVYGPVQLARIVTQSRLFALLDQWIILPFFAWIYIWGYHFLDTLILTRFRLVAIMGISVLSYLVTIFTPFGYSLVLAIHILFALITAVALQAQHGNKVTLLYILYGILLCFGYIGFKLIDFKLFKIHGIFKIVSGHFLSRVCDVLKIHVAALYFAENVKAAHNHLE